jgi:hypothetical protein
MRNSLFLLIIGLFFGGGLGYLIAATNNSTLDGHSHGAEVGMSGHDHSMMTPFRIADDVSAPTLQVVLHKDATAGYNLEVITTNYTFSPEQVNLENQPNVGHAHVYVNGEKLARIYAPWMHIGSLPSGKVEVSVSLNTNDHSPVFVGDAPLVASQTVTVE